MIDTKNYTPEKDERDRKIINDFLQNKKGTTMKTHIVEQDRDGMIIPVKIVWLVLQTQAECDYREYPIAVFTDEDDAYKLSRALNKRYGRGCRFTVNWDYDQDDTDEYDDTHYYTVGRYELNPKMEDYL